MRLWRRAQLAAGITVAIVLGDASPAAATWTAGVSGSARARSGVVPQVAKPTPVRTNGIRVTVDWLAVSLPGVSYQVLRDGGTAINNGTCSALVVGTSCTDTFAFGAHTYTVTAKLQQWSGVASPPSDPI